MEISMMLGLFIICLSHFDWNDVAFYPDRKQGFYMFLPPALAHSAVTQSLRSWPSFIAILVSSMNSETCDDGQVMPR